MKPSEIDSTVEREACEVKSDGEGRASQIRLKGSRLLMKGLWGKKKICHSGCDRQMRHMQRNNVFLGSQTATDAGGNATLRLGGGPQLRKKVVEKKMYLSNLLYNVS